MSDSDNDNGAREKERQREKERVSAIVDLTMDEDDETDENGGKVDDMEMDALDAGLASQRPQHPSQYPPQSTLAAMTMMGVTESKTESEEQEQEQEQEVLLPLQVEHGNSVPSDASEQKVDDAAEVAGSEGEMFAESNVKEKKEKEKVRVKLEFDTNPQMHSHHQTATTMQTATTVAPPAATRRRSATRSRSSSTSSSSSHTSQPNSSSPFYPTPMADAVVKTENGNTATLPPSRSPSAPIPSIHPTHTPTPIPIPSPAVTAAIPSMSASAHRTWQLRALLEWMSENYECESAGESSNSNSSRDGALEWSSIPLVGGEESQMQMMVETKGEGEAENGKTEEEGLKTQQVKKEEQNGGASAVLMDTSDAIVQPLPPDPSSSHTTSLSLSVSFDWTTLQSLMQSCSRDLSHLASPSSFRAIMSNLLMPPITAASHIQPIKGPGNGSGSSSSGIGVTRGDLHLLHQSLSACNLMLLHLTMPDASREIIREEYILATIAFINHIIKNVVMKAYDSNEREKIMTVVENSRARSNDGKGNGSGSGSGSGRGKARGSGSGKGRKRNPTSEDSSPNVSKRRRRMKRENGDDAEAGEVELVREKRSTPSTPTSTSTSSSSSSDAKYWRGVERDVQFVVTKLSTIVDRMRQLLSQECVSEVEMTALEDSALHVLSLTHAPSSMDLHHTPTLQLSCAHLLQQIFTGHDKRGREQLLEQLATMYKQLTPQRKNARIYIVHEGQQTIKVEQESSLTSQHSSSSLTQYITSMSHGGTMDELASSVGSNIPLPSTLPASTRPQLSIQLMTALVCHMLQSLSVEPLRCDEQRSSMTLIDRIKAEVKEQELRQRLEQTEKSNGDVESAKKQSGERKKKGGAHNKRKRRGSKDESAHTDSDTGATTTAIPSDGPSSSSSSSSSSVLSVLHSSLDTPLLRSQFVDVVTAPLPAIHAYLQLFLAHLFRQLRPPPASPALSTNSSVTASVRASKALLKAFVEDLLAILFTPEFPIAEQIIDQTIKHLIRIVHSSSSSASNKSSFAWPDGLRVSSVSLLGLISVHLSMHESITRQRPMTIRPDRVLKAEDAVQTIKTATGEDSFTTSDELLDCVCGMVTRDFEYAQQPAPGIRLPCLDCDRCHIWFHSPCVGFPSDPPDTYHCTSCVLRLECERQTEQLQQQRERLRQLQQSSKDEKQRGKKRGKGKDRDNDGESLSVASVIEADLERLQSELVATSTVDEHIMNVSSSVLRQICINYLNHAWLQQQQQQQQQESTTLLAARQYDLATWLREAQEAEDEHQPQSSNTASGGSAAPSSNASRISAVFEREIEMCQQNFEPPRTYAAAFSNDGSSSSSNMSHATKPGSMSVSAPSSTPSMLLVNSDEFTRMSRQLSANRRESILHLTNGLIARLCLSCEDASPKVRAAAVSALSNIIRVQPTLLTKHRIKSTLKSRIADSSIATREEVVELVGSYMLQTQADQQRVQQSLQQLRQARDGTFNAANASFLIPLLNDAPSTTATIAQDDEYLSFVLSRLSDDGISVRKRVVSIIRDLCMQQPPHHYYVPMMEKLIMMVRDTEESMQSLVIGTVYQLWFAPDLQTTTDRKRPVPANVQIHKPAAATTTAKGDASTATADSSSLTLPSTAAYDSLLLVSSAPFSVGFQTLVRLFIHVMSALSRVSSVSFGTASAGTECMADILSTLMEHATQLTAMGKRNQTHTPANAAHLTEATAITGLKLNLNRLRRGKQAKSSSSGTAMYGSPARTSPSHTRSPSTPASSLSQAISPTSGKRSRQSMTPSSSSSSSQVAADPTSIHSILIDMVSLIVSALIQTQETFPNESSMTISPAMRPATILACMQALHLFSQIYPLLLLPHLSTLLPYLKLGVPERVDGSQLADKHGEELELLQVELKKKLGQTNARNAQIVVLLIQLFHNVLPVLSSSSMSVANAVASSSTLLSDYRSFGASLATELQSLLQLSDQPALIRTLIPTWVRLCDSLLQTPAQVWKVLIFYTAFMWSQQRHVKQLSGNTVRVIIALALIIKHFDVDVYYRTLNAANVAEGRARTFFWREVYNRAASSEQFRQAFEPLKGMSQWMLTQNARQERPIVDTIFALYKQYITAMSAQDHEDEVKQVQGRLNAAETARLRRTRSSQQPFVLQGIIALFSRKPKLIQESRDVINLCLSPHSSDDLHLQSLRSLREFLESEDRRLQNNLRLQRIRNKANRGRGRGREGEATDGQSRNDDGDDGDDDDGDGDNEDDVEEGGNGMNMNLEVVAAASTDASSLSAAVTPTKSWVDANVDAADFLPSLVAQCEESVYALASSRSPSVRSEALQFISVFLHQAVTNPVDAMPTLIACMTDRDSVAQQQASTILHALIHKKKEYMRFMETRFAQGIERSFEMQSKLFQTFDPLHRKQLNQTSATHTRKGQQAEEPIFDSTPFHGIASLYACIKKSIPARKQFCRMLINELMSVNHIGIFARESEDATTDMESSQPGAAASFPSPPSTAPLVPHPSLTNRTLSGGSHPPLTPTPSQGEDFPSFVPPVLSHSNTSPFMVRSASNASFVTASDGATSGVGHSGMYASRWSAPLSFLAYVASLCASLPFEDDEPIHLCVHLSKLINTRGAALQAKLKRSSVELKRLAGEEVDERDVDEAEGTDQGNTQHMEEDRLDQERQEGSATTSLSPTAAGLPHPPTDKDSLLTSLRLQCESAMSMCILIHLRQWLQKSYDLTGKFEEWNVNAMTPSKTPLRLPKKFDLPLHFHQLPLELEHGKEWPPAFTLPDSHTNPSSQRPKLPHARHASAPAFTSLPTLPTDNSIIPPLLAAQSSFFHSAMDDNAIFLATGNATMRRTGTRGRRGHKRSATMAAFTNAEDGTDADAQTHPASSLATGTGTPPKRARPSQAKRAKAKGGRKRKTQQKSRRRRRYEESDSEEEEEEEYDGESEEEENEEEEDLFDSASSIPSHSHSHSHSHSSPSSVSASPLRPRSTRAKRTSYADMEDVEEEEEEEQEEEEQEEEGDGEEEEVDGEEMGEEDEVADMEEEEAEEAEDAEE